MDDINADVISYDMNHAEGVQCLALARNEKARHTLHERGYIDFFTPEKHGINCWILIRVESEHPL